MVSLRAMLVDALGADPDDLGAGGASLGGGRLGGAARPPVAAALATCPPGGVVPARDDDAGGAEVAVVRLVDGRAFVVADRCPHDGGRLSDGFVDGDRLVCARHGWEVDPCTGTCGRGRAPVPTRAA